MISAVLVDPLVASVVTTAALPVVVVSTTTTTDVVEVEADPATRPATTTVMPESVTTVLATAVTTMLDLVASTAMLAVMTDMAAVAVLAVEARIGTAAVAEVMTAVLPVSLSLTVIVIADTLAPRPPTCLLVLPRVGATAPEEVTRMIAAVTAGDKWL